MKLKDGYFAWYKLDENKKAVETSRYEANEILKKGEQVIKKTKCGPYLISTIFLVIDHGFDGVPIHFETIIFCDDQDDPLANFQERYKTYEEAILGHEKLVEKCAEACKERNEKT